MSVSRKHMEWAASYLAANLASDEAANAECSITVQMFADFFAEFNPRFNKMRFAEAVRTRSHNGECPWLSGEPEKCSQHGKEG